MKPPLLLLAAGALALCPSAFSAPLHATSRITAVTVYTDRAVITRTASLDIGTTGAIEVAFEKLPATLVDPSLTVGGRGAAQATILDVTTRKVHVESTPNERVKALEDEVRDLARQRRTLDDRGNVLKAQEASLDRLEGAATAAPTKDAAPRLTIEESIKLLAFLEEQRSKRLAERQALDAKLEELEARRTALEKQLAAIRGHNGRAYKTVVVRLDAATAGRLDLTVSYALPDASWTPSYDVRANSNAAAIELSYFGRVRQNTGEDWNDVALTLSTAQPSLGGAAPEVGTWVVDVRAPVGGLVLSTAAEVADLRFDKFAGQTAAPAARARSAATPPPPAVFGAKAAEATVEAAATSASFKITSAATVPSDNSPQKIPVTSVSLGAVPEYSTTPRKLAAAFLTAKVTNTSEFPLLPGAMNVFLDGTFVATSAVKTVMPGEKFDLALGADEGISVKHKRVQRFAEDTGLTNRGRRVTYEYLVTIQNNKKSPARIVVADHVPLSRYERIVVKVLSPSEKEQKPAADGALKWTLDLKPGEKRELPLKFSVEHPTEIQVAGLEA